MIDARLNENNLDAFGEEVSHYVEDNSGEMSQGISSLKDEENYTNDVLKNDFNNVLNHNYVASYQNDMNSLQNQISEIWNELQEKNKKIEYLLDKHKKKDILIINMKKNIKILSDKSYMNDQLRNKNDLQTNHIREYENEVYYLKLDNMKFQETIINKDNIINEFHNLSEITKSKFRMFEEANHHLKEDNEIMSQRLEEYENKIIPQLIQSDKIKEIKLNELKNSSYKLERELEEIKSESFKRDDYIKRNFEEKEKIYKHKSKEREDILKNDYIREISAINNIIEILKIENEKLKYEIKTTKNLSEETEILNDDKESDFKRLIESKDKDYEKLKKNLRDLQKDINDLELKLTDRQSEYAFKLKSQEENITKYLSQISFKDKRNKELEEENNNYKIYISELENTNKDFEIKLENKDRIIEQLKNQNSEILKEFNRMEIEYTSNENNKVKETNELLYKIKELNLEKNNLKEENEELKENLLNASEKLSEMNDLIIDKYQGIEMSYYKEKMNKENIEKKFSGVIKKLKENNDDLNNRIITLNEAILARDEEIENLKLKYDNKVQSLKLKLQGHHCLDNNPTRSDIEPIKLKSKKCKEYYQPSNFFNNQESQKQTIDSLKEIINRIDNKMGFSNVANENSASFINLKNSDIFDKPYKI